jgi:hypothetical protein
MNIPRTLVVITALGGAMFAAGCDVGQHPTWSKSTTLSFTVTDPVTAVQVDASGGSIRVDAGQGSGIQVTESVQYDDSVPAVSHPVDGGKLTLKDPSCNCRINYTLLVPPSLAVTLDSHGGNIDLADISGTVDASSSGGRLNGTGLAARTVRARGGGGDIDLRFVSQPALVDADSSGGSVSVRLPSAGAYAVSADTAGGGETVKVHRDKASPHQVRLHSSGGSISVLPAG